MATCAAKVGDLVGSYDAGWFEQLGVVELGGLVERVVQHEPRQTRAQIWQAVPNMARWSHIRGKPVPKAPQKSSQMGSLGSHRPFATLPPLHVSILCLYSLNC